MQTPKVFVAFESKKNKKIKRPNKNERDEERQLKKRSLISSKPDLKSPKAGNDRA